ncbi:hypothetical protein B0H67DRAFT_124495 [Lasiosphaeris hirsuta]|uniref:Uncharacterized protein n=1 Tax=Lasiosphaeris hirsuta TaxID=260670 RepID=A0AA40E7F3_9PEZI|nr:hypothetical protein B0H67DRAFT_124495 [Lasiosphaeris hirsuta]
MYHTGNKMLRKYRLPKEQPSDMTPKSSKPRKLRKDSPDSPSGFLRSPLTPRNNRASFSSSGPESTSASSNSSVGSMLDDPPPWDRSVDVVWNRRLPTQDKMEWDDELAFQENCVRLAGESTILFRDGSSGSSDSQEGMLGTSKWPRAGKRAEVSRKDNGPYFKLPDRVRFMIAKHIVGSHDSGKAIRMNSPTFLEPIWPVNHAGTEGERVWSTEYFDSLGKVLALLRGYTAVCFAMRIDILTTLFLTRRFHVVYSPFVTMTTQPAAVLFMDRFGHLMKWITLEVDLSRLGGHWHSSAACMDMGKNLVRVRTLIASFAERQLTRTGAAKIQSLVVLVRRYYGYRPLLEQTARGSKESERVNLGDKSNESEQVIRFEDDEDNTILARPDEARTPYCSDRHLSVLDPIMLLEGLVDSLCIVGANKAYARQLILALWGGDGPISLFQPFHSRQSSSTSSKLSSSTTPTPTAVIRTAPNGTTSSTMTVRDISKHCQYRAPSCAYPFTPGQRSVVDYGPPRGLRVIKHVTDPRKWRGLYGCALSPNVTVTEIVREDGGVRYKVGGSGAVLPVPGLLAIPGLGGAPVVGSGKMIKIGMVSGVGEVERSYVGTAPRGTRHGGIKTWRLSGGSTSTAEDSEGSGSALRNVATPTPGASHQGQSNPHRSKIPVLKNRSPSNKPPPGSASAESSSGSSEAGDENTPRGGDHLGVPNKQRWRIMTKASREVLSKSLFGRKP